MQLSEAIRLGAMLKPQTVGLLFRPRTGGTCAFGAAFDALGILPQALETAYGATAIAYWPWIDQEEPNPISGRVDSVINIIIGLNDMKHWSRERIADWVASVEPLNTSAESGAAVLVEIGTQ